jgi:branched-chain amino acid transport system substrate-binding protein
METAEPDAIMYGGYIAEAAPLLKQIRDAGITAPFIGGDGLYGADFGNAVGDAGEGAVVMCPCAPIEGDSTFAADFEKAYGGAPGAYAAEGFDAMTVFLKGLEDGARDRAAMLEFVSGYTGDGLSKAIAFDENGDVPQDQVSYWAYKNEGGTLTPEVEVKPAE